MPVSVTEINVLNEKFNIPGKLTFVLGPGGLHMAEVANDYTTGRLFLHGAHVPAYHPRGQKPVIWVSEESFYLPDKAIRGGIPVCWPWFGDHPTDRDKPAHGFVRTALWEARETEQTKEGSTRIRLGIVDNERTRTLWPHAFDLEMTVTFGENLVVTLTARNTGKEAFQCGGALHTYFAVEDSSRIGILGLEGLTYVDKVDGLLRKVQQGPVRIQGETDSIYLETGGECIIEDPAWQREIRITKKGSRTTVVWNPGSEKASGMKDFGNQEYKDMVCVETANAAEDIITVEPGQKHILETEIKAMSTSR